MASLDKRNNAYRLRWIDAARKRCTMHLGRVPKRQAEQIQSFVERLVVASITGLPMDSETARWLASIGDDLAVKLARAGLAKPRPNGNLFGFVDEYIAGRSVKRSTRVRWGQVRRYLAGFFGPATQLAHISRGLARDFRESLLDKGLADATIARAMGTCKQWYSDAVDRGLCPENPFRQKALPCSVRSNLSRKVYVSRETISRVIDAAPSVQWRLLIALARFGGLRCPSEPMALRWSDVLWDRQRFLVNSPKTGLRLVPIFPELAPHLEAAFDSADPGEWVITLGRDSAKNLRTQFERIICRAGVAPWPKLFQNLRASCETDLARNHPIKAVCDWIGHGVGVAIEHYMQTTERDFDRAVLDQNWDHATSTTDIHQQSENPESRGNHHDSQGLPT